MFRNLGADRSVADRGDRVAIADLARGGAIRRSASVAGPLLGTVWLATMKIVPIGTPPLWPRRDGRIVDPGVRGYSREPEAVRRSGRVGAGRGTFCHKQSPWD